MEHITHKSKDQYVQEVLIRYLEDLEDLQIGLKRLKSKSPTYTAEEADKRLKELRETQLASKNV